VSLIEDDPPLPFDTVPYEPASWATAGFYGDSVVVEVCPSCFVACRVIIGAVEANSQHLCRDLSRDRRTDRAPVTWLNSYQIDTLMNPAPSFVWN